MSKTRPRQAASVTLQTCIKVPPWRSQEQRKRETIGGNDWCRTFSDLLAPDCTPILCLGGRFSEGFGERRSAEGKSPAKAFTSTPTTSPTRVHIRAKPWRRLRLHSRTAPKDEIEYLLGGYALLTI